MKKFICQLYTLDRLDDLIRRRATGSPKQLACRLGVSKRTVYNFLDTLRDFGADVRYCPSRNSYYYANGFRFEVNIYNQEE